MRATISIPLRRNSPFTWFIRSTDPYNRIGKHALTDVYDWRDRGLVDATPVLGPTPAEDMIVVRAR
jgi:hypothetical protein